MSLPNPLVIRHFGVRLNGRSETRLRQVFLSGKKSVFGVMKRSDYGNLLDTLEPFTVFQTVERE